MMMEGLMVQADRLLEVCEHGSWNDWNRSGGGQPFKNLEERLLEIHIEESLKCSSSSGSSSMSASSLSTSSHLNPCSNLLALICNRDNSGINRLVLSLKDQGYSLKAKRPGGKEPEVDLLSIPEDPCASIDSDSDFISYINNQELPPMLLDLFETFCPDLYYNGCIIVEIRDYRRLKNKGGGGGGGSGVINWEPKSVFVLLKPTTQSIICDSDLITRSGRWTPEEKINLESQLLLATQGPLCLDPNPVVSVVARKSILAKQKLNTVPVRRNLKRNRKRKSQQLLQQQQQQQQQQSAGSPTNLFDFIQRVKANRSESSSSINSTHNKHQSMMRLALRGSINSSSSPGIAGATSAMNSGIPSETILTPPTSTDVAKRARTIKKRSDSNDMTPHIVEEYILETAESRNHTRLTIFQRLANDEYLAELYVETDYRENENKGSTCRFVLGTQPHALRYINQFTEIFTEEGRKSVKITHRVPNQQPRVTYTPGMRERLNEREKLASVKFNNSSGNTNAPNNAAQAAAAAAQAAAQAAAVAAQPQVSKVPLHSLQPQQPPPPTLISQQFNHQPQAATASPHPAPILQSQLTMQQSVNPSTPTKSVEIIPVGTNDGSQEESFTSSEQNASANGSQTQEKMAISAIMQSLMQDTARFEADKSRKQSTITTPQLPTRPVPAASLAESVNTNTTPIKTPPAAAGAAATNQKLMSKQISFQNILTNPQAAQQQTNTVNKVTMPQLAAQLSRPVLNVTHSASLPSYTQAQQMKPKLVVTSQQQNKLKHETPGLQALLANTPSADNPGVSAGAVSVPTSVVGTTGGGSLLERLVSGQTTVASSSAIGVTTPVNTLADSTQDITLATLLAKPSNNQHQLTTVFSANKVSPLVQQLQQPIQPRQVLQTASPRIVQSSPSSSPNRLTVKASPTHLQQALPIPTSSMITVPLQQQENYTNSNENPSAQPQNIVNLQNLLQSGLVQVNNHTTGGGVSGAVPTTSSVSTANNASTVQLSIPGLASPVTLSVNLPTASSSTNDGNIANNSQSQINVSSPSVFVTNHGHSAVKQGNKIVSASPGTVLFQSPNIIQLPPAVTTASLGNMRPLASAQPIKTIGTAGTGSSLVQVRGGQVQGQPVFLQVPTSGHHMSTGTGVKTSQPQSIQIVRSQSVVRPQQQVVINSIRNPVQPIISTAAQSQQSQGGDLVAIQLQQPTAAATTDVQQQQLLLAGNGTGQIKMRQQRKQSLK